MCLRPLLIATIALSSCDNPSDSLAANEIAGTQNEVAQLRSDLTQSQEQIEALQASVERLSGRVAENATNTDSLTKTVNSNVAVANRNKLREMTIQGACGYTKPYKRDDGVIVSSAPIECTLDDLR